MADEEDHVDVTIEDAKESTKNEPDVVIEEEKPVRAEKKDASPEIPAEEGIQELKKKLEIERLARTEAERRAQHAQERVQKAYGEVTDANYQLVSNAIDTLKTRDDALKVAYKEAFNVGDADKLAEIAEAIALNKQQLSELKKGKKAMKDQIKQAESAPAYQAPQSGDIVDQVIATVAPSSPKSAVWLQQNRENIRTERDVRKMFRAHEDAVDDGLTPDTDEYFNYIEGRLGIRRQYSEPQTEATADNPLSSASAPKRSAPPPAAPVSRGGNRPNVVRLSREQADTARALGMSESDYAKNMVALQKEGKLGH